MNDEALTHVELNSSPIETDDSVLAQQEQMSEAPPPGVHFSQSVVIASTFTADLISKPLKFWMATVDISAEITVAPYAQVMQELLDPESMFSRNRSGFNILLVRLEDWIRDRLAEQRSEQDLKHIRRVANEFVMAMGALRHRSGTPILLYFCPSSSSLPISYSQPIEEIQRDLVGRLGSLAHVHCWAHTDLVRLYPLIGHEDPRADHIGHIPYTSEYFAAIATLLARRITVLLKPQYKVIAIDCDNTLWKGICGEDGAAGVQLTPAHLRFQQMLVRQHDAGMLLCLCTKNNSNDVEAVFRNRSEMLLRAEHLICSRANWNSKSSNLQSLAQELDLSLDSFVFIDDSPMECAEVRANCPPVLTLQFPEASDEIEHFINHIWAFDRIGITEEAKRRTEQYRENRERTKALQDIGSLEQFVASLELQVDVAPMQLGQLARVAELIQRTNQFNLTSFRRRSSEIESLWKSGDLSVLVIHVRDRFGDYGLVGAVFYRRRLSSIDVDSFVLSCRALGRGVEHQIVNELGRIARREGLLNIALKYRQTPRNAPAREFLEKSFAQFQVLFDGSSNESLFAIPVEYAQLVGGESSLEEITDTEVGSRTTQSTTQVSGSAQWHEAAYRFSRLADVVRELSRVAQRRRSSSIEYVEPRTSTETAVAEIWAEILGLDEVSVCADFFDLGGDSLLAVQVIASIGSVLGFELSVYDFFEGPTIEEVASKLTDAAQSDFSIQRMDRTRVVPLSSAQQRLWFIDRLENGSAAYHVPVGIRFRGDLDRTALQTALNALVDRHEALRTIFTKKDGEPEQQITLEGCFALRLVDLSGRIAEERDAEVFRESQEELTAVFDLSTGPLIRGRLLQLSDNEHVLLITMHHIVSDGWSIGVLIRELAALYEGCRQQQSSPLPPLPIQYADYAQWQRQWLAGAELQHQLSYWKEHLRAAPELLELPTDRPRPVVQSYRGANVQISLGTDLITDLKAFSRRHGLTLAMTLYGAWSIVLSRLSGQEDIVLGIPVANRRRTEFEGLIGLFVNTLAVRLKVEDDPSVVDLLQRAKETMLGAFAYQDVPFESVVEVLQPTRNLSHSPIFQVMFVLQPEAKEVSQCSELTMSQEEVPLQTAQFDLLLSLQESAAGISGSLNYATDLFDAATVQRWAECFEVVLRRILHESQINISRLSLLSDHERRQIIRLFNATETDYPREKLIHELFEEQVERAPSAVAVVYEEQVLTYAELNTKANQLARYLREKGVGPDRLVGICIERSLEMVVGLLGILKAGGAYVPLDPNYPAERLEYMLQNAAPSVLLTQEELKSRLLPMSTEVMPLDSRWSEIAEFEDGNLDPIALGLTSRHLAYVIYTSGSTGQPKGAMNEHRALINRLQWMQNEYQLDDSDRVLQKTPFSFDVSVWEFFWTLMSGARLIMARPQGHQDPEYLRRLIEEKGVTRLHFVPSMLQIFLHQYRAGECMSLRHVVCSGEELPPALQNRCLKCLPNVRLSNLYGPTEAAIDVTAWECELDERSSRVPIGRPISNTQMYVLDRHGHPVPIGVSGEIYIGGAGVGRGYLNRPELTQERFIHDPFSPDPQARLYKTGDVGRWRADGAIEYLGRNDHQVKIRGFRIELGEIETQLAQHSQVKEAVVIAREDVPGEKRLVAYVVSAEVAVPSVEALRTHLKAVMPEYMVPSAFVMLERLPLTPNGKLDRRALPAPELGAYVSRQYEAPQGDVEEILAGIWQSLLHVERVGRQDNFFELGGHSLLIMQMMERLRRVGLSAEVRRVFESPALADLASAITDNAVEQFEVPPNLIPPGCEVITPQMLPLIQLEAQYIDRIVQSVPGGAANIQDIYPLAPLQEGILFHHLLNEGRGDTYVSSVVLSVPSRDRLEELVAALQAVIDRHDALRTAVLWEGLPQPVQVVYRQATLPVEELALDSERDSMEQIREWIKTERQRLDLPRAPLMQLQVAAEANGGRWYLLLHHHHITSDHVSMEMVNSEVAAYLEGCAQTMSESMPYRNHVAQALAYSRTHDAEAFFREKLDGIDEPTAPFGLLDVHGDGSQIEEARKEFELTLAQRVRTQARCLGVSAATLFHAVWGLVVAHTSGRDDVVFGSVLLGRLQGNAGAQKILGMFINTLPLRLQLRGLTAKKLVEQTQRELIDLLNHEQASLAAAQRCSGIVGSAPLFTALFNYRHRVLNLDARWSSVSDIQEIEVQDRTNYPITLSVDDLGERFLLKVQTDRRIDPRRMTSYVYTAMESLIEALEQSSQKPALELSILPETERRQMIELFNATKADYPREKLIHELFEEQVERTPKTLAVMYEGQSLTYAELNAKANQLARYLREKGVGPDRLVGICIERSLEMIVGLLGILKAGGAYVPLDPDYPTERLQHILEDSRPQVVLTQDKLRVVLPATRAAIVALDNDWDEIMLQPSTNAAARTIGLRANHLAYVIYTSGSTGQPKGVMIEHSNVLSLWQGLESIYQQSTSCQRIGVNASFNFDASVKQFVQLLSGRTIVLVPQKVRWDASMLMDFIDENQIEGIDCTPWQLRSWISAGLLNDNEHQLRVVLVGGEPIDIELWSSLSQCSKVNFYNVYGPTESTVDTTFAHLNSDTTTPHIGRPMENRHVYILNRDKHPVPIGVSGEIYIGGAGVGRGYLNRPELTQERFIHDPFSPDPQARLYKTGDVGRWRADGAIEYLGRNDHQVKIRGFRIELGEIETQLAQHSQVKEAVVIAREDVPGEKRLVAYVVSAEVAVPSVEALRTHLKAVMPEYMVPSAFVMLERLPLTPNGKLDRRALPAPELGAYASRQYEAPQGDVEEILAGIWQSLLHVERVGRQDNFFELGGHSLLIMQMMERLRRVGLSAEVRRVFESPALADLASAITDNAVEQFEVPPNLIPPGCEVITPQMLPLIQLEAQYIDRIVQSVPGGAANVQDIYPLAPLQEGILFHHLLNEGGGDLYLEPTVLSVASRDRLEELIVALQAVIDRHDVLRTAILWEELPQPVQVVYRQATLPVEELALDSERDSMEQIRECIKTERQRLDLRRAPLMQLQVAAEANSNRWYVLLQRHHIICDHITLEIIISEVVSQLEADVQRVPVSLPYRNHVAQVLAYARTNDLEAFFRGKLGEIGEPTAPFGLLDVHGDGSQIAEAREAFESALAQRVRTQARRLSVSAATLFHAAWSLVIAHTSERDDVVFGTLLSGRLQGNAGAQRVLGMFINTLPLRLQLKGVTAKELVEQTQHELVELLSHEQASLAIAQRCSGIVGSAPLFTTLLNYRHSASKYESLWSGATGIQVLAFKERSNYPIALSVDDLGVEFALTAQTDPRIDPHKITGYLHTAVQSLVEALEQAPQKPALELRILPESERHQVLELFNATQMAGPQTKLMHQLFEEQVERTPAAVAVICGDRQLTYEQLNRRTNQLAHALLVRGVRPDDRVAFYLERSVEMVVGLLAILKAGGAYVPLDVSYPAERLTYMLQDAAPRVVLTQERLAKSLPANSAQVIRLDADANEFDRQSDANISAADFGLTPQHLAYVIYTSGSTGLPKGVMVEHRNLVNLARWHCAAFDVREGSRSSCVAALGFDATVWEVWPPLSVGATLVLAPPEVINDVEALITWWASQPLDVSFLPTPMAEFVFSGNIRNPTLRTLLVGGDRLRHRPVAESFSLVNNYGPTECTVVATSGRIDDEDTVLHIGRPIANAQIYILDSRQQPAPIGVSGEIYIGGAGVARGYLNRPELTAERFLRDPFSTDPQARMYRAGDLGRWRSDGTIEYLGRNDDQVKIRGFRIELGEIETQLAHHEQVKDAVVIVREDVPGEKRLVAYVVPDDSAAATAPNAEALREHLKTVLPEYMVPSALIMMQSLPLTPHGKLDRRALPAPELGAYSTQQYEAPQGEVEQKLAEIWQELLGVQRVGRQDNFFELGGHSLLVVSSLFKINQAFDSTLRVPDVYKNPTLRELAARICGTQTEDEFIDLSREAALDDSIVAAPGRVSVPARAVMLTGSTGFVGRFLLAQLLRDTDATIYCLVRAQSEHQALSRVRAALVNWDLWREEFEQRIVAFPGDLRLPRLGIKEETYRTLCRRIDAIYHCATSMNHLETYAMAKPANVGSARELLEFATQQKPKLINYISTLGVFRASTADPSRIADEQSTLDHETHRNSQGYAASKWVGEKLFMAASERGIACNIFRLGLVWADTQQGRFDELQQVYRTLKSSLLAGYGISNFQYQLAPTPVDYVARSIVFLANQHPEGQGIFHISSSGQMSEGVFERCNEIAGTSLELVSHYEWICEIKRLHYEGRSLPVVPLIEHTFSMDEKTFEEQRRDARAARIRFDCVRTHRELERAGIVAPVLNDDLLRLSLESMFLRDAELREWSDCKDNLRFARMIGGFDRHGLSGSGG